MGDVRNGRAGRSDRDDEIIVDLAWQLDAMGCTADEMDRVRRDLQRELPNGYATFLRCLGRDGGGLFGDQVVCFPHVLGLRTAALELLEENGNLFVLADESVVIAVDQGYQFWFIRSDVIEPEVQWWSEGRAADTASVYASSVRQWLLDERDKHSSARAAQSRAATKAMRRQQFDLERCPLCGQRVGWSIQMTYSQGATHPGRPRQVGHCSGCGSGFSRSADEPHSALHRES